MTNWGLLNMCDYTNRHTVARLLRRHDTLYKLAERGDMVALCIYIDLADAMMADKVLTARQREILLLWVDGFSQTEIAEAFNSRQYTISRSIKNIAERISKYLSDYCIKVSPQRLYVEGIYLQNKGIDTDDSQKEKESKTHVV